MRAVLARLRPSRDARDATVRLAGPAAIVARVAATAAAVAIAALGAAVPPAPPATAAPARQATPIPPLACTWDKLPVSATQGVYFMATAYDTLHHKLYSYGGVDQSGDLVNIVGALDVSDADPAKAGFQPVVPSGSRVERYGTAGAFRPKGDDSAIYWIGGADDSGGATTEVQIFNIKANTWRKVTPAGSQKRAFHAAAYDPVHDVVVVHGGTKQCKVVDVQPTDDCEGDNLRTQFLAIDANGDVSWVNGPQGGPSQILGLTMVYDSVRKRMIAYAGTSDGNLATDRVWVLRLHDADLANATWSNLNVTGTTAGAVLPQRRVPRRPRHDGAVRRRDADAVQQPRERAGRHVGAAVHRRHDRSMGEDRRLDPRPRRGVDGVLAEAQGADHLRRARAVPNGHAGGQPRLLRAAVRRGANADGNAAAGHAAAARRHQPEGVHADPQPGTGGGDQRGGGQPQRRARLRRAVQPEPAAGPVLQPAQALPVAPEHRHPVGHARQPADLQVRLPVRRP